MGSYAVAAHKPGIMRAAEAARTVDVPVIFIVDPDDETRRAFQQTLGQTYVTRAFAGAAAFFSEHDPEIPGCIIIESSVPETDGFATLARLTAADCGQPVIFLSADASVSTTVKALRAGAINFLAKPVSPEVLLAAVGDALKLEATRHDSIDRRRRASKRLSALTQREHEVLTNLVSGKLNKQIAAKLGIAEKTVKSHRARIMQKLAVRSLAELVLFASTTNTAPSRRPFELREAR